MSWTTGNPPRTAEDEYKELEERARLEAREEFSSRRTTRNMPITSTSASGVELDAGNKTPRIGQSIDELRVRYNIPSSLTSPQAKVPHNSVEDDDNHSVTSIKSSASVLVENSITKEMLRSLPTYDGRGNATSLFEFIGKFEDYFDMVEVSDYHQVMLTTARLSGPASMWWRSLKTKGLRETVKTWSTFKDLLVQRFTPPDHQRRVRNELQDLRQSKTVLHYNDAFNALAMQLIDLGKNESLSYYLRGLNENIRILLEANQDNIDDLATAQHVALRIGSSRNQENSKRSTALVSQDSFSKQRHAKGQQHKKTKSPPICVSCNKPGHIFTRCPILIEKVKALKISDQNERVSMVAAEGSDNVALMSWVWDTGASCHMTGDRNLFSHYIPRVNKFVTVGNGAKLPVLGSGIVQVGDVKLNEVLHVSNMRFNLISCAKFCRDNDIVSHHDGKVLTLIKEGHQVGRFPLNFRNDLVEVNLHHIALATTIDTSDQQLWHLRMGHLGYQNLTKLPHIVTGMNTLKKNSDHVCSQCQQGKQHRSPFQTSIRVVNDLLEIVSSDLCGPMPESLGGAKYYITFIDHASRNVWITFLKKKSDAFQAFVKFHKAAERECGKPLKTLRTDNGGEYSSKEFNEYLEEAGIRHETTVPYSPQQNGLAERMNRTIQEKTIAMLSHAQFDKRLWAEAANTTVYLMNRSPCSYHSTTPYEKWCGRKPDISHLKVFGCEAHCWIPKDKRRKLDPKSYLGYLVGYDQTSKGFRILKESRVKIVRDVVFDEQQIHKSNAKIELTFDDKSEEYENIQTEIEGKDKIRRSTRLSQKTPVNYNESSEDDETLLLISRNEPNSFRQAIKCEDAAEWRCAIQSEINSLVENKTWEISDLPTGRKPVASRWVFKLKLNPDGTVNKYKARLVAKGYSQVEGIDYQETFAPVARLQSVRLLLAVAVSHNLKILHLDVMTAFLNGELDEDIYMRIPEGAGLDNEKDAGKVLKLRKCLYGLKQSGRMWYLCLHEFLVTLNFVPLQSDCSIYRKNHTYIAVYVDDILVVATIEETISIKSRLMDKFKMTDNGELKHYLGMEVENTATGLKLYQRHYIFEMLERFGMSECKPCSTPATLDLKKQDTGEDIDATEYRSILGSLMYLSVCTRPDISATISHLSQFMTQPKTCHLTALKRVLRYLKATINMGLEFKKGQGLTLVGYSDSDWANEVTERRSMSGYVFLLEGTAITWSATRQKTIALSTVEAEYMSQCEAGREATWLRRFLKELGFDVNSPTIIHCDNQGAIALAGNPIHHRRTKHIDVRYHYIRKLVEEGEVRLQYLETEKMVADFLTKPMSSNKLSFCCNNIGLRQSESKKGC